MTNLFGEYKSNIEYLKEVLENFCAGYNSIKKQIPELEVNRDLLLDLLCHDFTDINSKDDIYFLLDSLNEPPSIYSKIVGDMLILNSSKSNGITDSKEYVEARNRLQGYKNNYAQRLQTIERKITAKKNHLANNNCEEQLIENILSKFHNRQKITASDQAFIQKLCKKNNLSDIQIIVLTEYIKIYNEKVQSHFENSTSDNKTFVIRLLEENPITTFDMKNEPDYETNSKFITDTTKELYEQLYRESIKGYYNKAPNETIYNIQELIADIELKFPDKTDSIKWVLIELMNLIRGKIVKLKESISQKEFYLDDEIRDGIIYEYKILLKDYQQCHIMYQDILTKSEERTNELTVKNEIVFSSEKSIMHDLANAPQEYLGKIWDLITRFQTGDITNSEYSGFKLNYTGFRKLKSDQIRIIITQLENNIYCIMGVAIKKEQSGERIYRTYTNRPIPGRGQIAEALELSPGILEKIEDYINENKRNGRR